MQWVQRFCTFVTSQIPPHGATYPQTSLLQGSGRSWGGELGELSFVYRLSSALLQWGSSPAVARSIHIGKAAVIIASLRYPYKKSISTSITSGYLKSESIIELQCFGALLCDLPRSELRKEFVKNDVDRKTLTYTSKCISFQCIQPVLKDVFRDIEKWYYWMFNTFSASRYMDFGEQCGGLQRSDQSVSDLSIFTASNLPDLSGANDICPVWRKIMSALHLEISLVKL